MRKSALGWLRPTRNPQETRSRVPHLFERLEPRLLLSVVFENVQPTDPATPDQYAIYLDQQAQGAQASQLSVPGGELAVTDGGSVATLEALAEEQWVPYVPTAEQTVISMISDDVGTRATVTLTFPDAGYQVTDWGTAHEEGGRFSVNVEVEHWTGPSPLVITKVSHEYDFGPITGGPYEFAFYASQQYIESRFFTPGMERWVPYVPTAEQMNILIVRGDTGMKAIVTATFGFDHAYIVREWGTVHQAGNTFTVNAEMERLEGIAVVSQSWTDSHEYDLGVLPSGDYVFEFHVWDQPVASREFRLGPEQWVQSVPTEQQTSFFFMADGACGTKARVAIDFFDTGYRVLDWGTVQQVGNTLSANAQVEQSMGAALCVITPVAHDYDLGSLPEGEYVFQFNAWQQPVESQEFTIPAVWRPVFRFWSPKFERHFYTLSTAERDKLINHYSDVWTYEKVAYYAFAAATEPDTVPVYRFWSGTLRSHFYTVSEAERDKLINNYAQTWAYEGIAFYVYPSSPGSVHHRGTYPVYRLWSSSLGTHFFTASGTEVEKLFARMPGVWDFEAAAWYTCPYDPSTNLDMRF